MKQAKELRDIIKNISDSGIGQISIGTIKSVDKNKCNCTVAVDGLEIIDVRLKTTMNKEPGFKIFPVVDSLVLVEEIEEGKYVVQMMSEIESVEWTVKKKLFIDAEQFEFGHEGLNLLLDGVDKKAMLKNSSKSFIDLLDSLYDVIMNLKVLTSQGPSSGLVATSISDLAKWKADYNLLIK